MKVTLLVSEGAHKGKEIPIRSPRFVIGRDPECQLRPASPMISRRHCALLTRDGKVFLEDFGSTNGTRVNDERVNGEVELRHEDRIKVDPLVFTVRIEADKPAPQKAPTPQTNGAPAGTEDDSIAAMLLEIQDEAGSVPSGPIGEADIPTGTTVMQVPGSPEEETAAAGAEAGAAKKGAKKVEDVNTAAAAKLLLDKYTRRKRP